MGTILNTTQNFLKLYLHACGKSEVPTGFHLWSCLSLIAACVADRVKICWIEEQPISPNLYVFLIAPSGIGKNVATTIASQYIVAQDGWVKERVNYYRGKLTPQFLHDKLGAKAYSAEKDAYVQANSKIWFVTPELTYGMGKGELSEQLVETMTELYSSGHIVISEGTRTRGELTVEDPNINWLAGTTKEWLVDAVKPKGIKSGFFARVIPIHYRKMIPEEAVWAPIYPRDRPWVVQYLRARVQALCYTEGVFEITPEADAYGRQWYFNRAKPEDEFSAVFWNRAREMMLKIAMLLALADGGPLKILPTHFQKAHTWYEMMQEAAKVLIELACQTPQTHGVKTVAGLIEKAKEMDHSKLLVRAHKYGLDSKAVREAVCTLQQWGNVEPSQRRDGERGRQKVVYVWRDKN